MAKKNKDYQEMMVEMRTIARMIKAERPEVVIEMSLEGLPYTREDCLKGYDLWQEVMDFCDSMNN